MSRTASINAKSREPRSRNIACFTVGAVVSGPGVKRTLSFQVGMLSMGGSVGLVLVKAAILAGNLLRKD